jgi:hypothetical protein
MIVDIPTADDFEKSGVSMLNLGWDSAAGLYRDLKDSEVERWDEEGRIREEFWGAATGPLAVALALVQQGVELLLKGKVVSVSPFLLISGSPKEWPSGCDQKDTPFADFKTIDSHDLIRTHDAVCTTRIPDDFRQEFERLRRLRNAVLHGVDKRVAPNGRDVFLAVLKATETLLEPQGWMARRYEYLENSPQTIAHWSLDVPMVLSPEAELLIQILGPAELKKFFGYDRKARSYICYFCATTCSDLQLRPRTAQLRPNTPDSTEVWCFACDEEMTVNRLPCQLSDCKGNVIHEDGICLTCYGDAG